MPEPHARLLGRFATGHPDSGLRLGAGDDDGLHWQVLRRFRGRTVAGWLRDLHGPRRTELLERYVDAAFAIAAIDSAREYGTLVGHVTYASWAACLHARLERSASARARLTDAVPKLPSLLARSLFGDPLLDVVGAIVMADLSTNVTHAEQRALHTYARQRAGTRFDEVFGCYELFYALYYAMDERLLPWCAKVLRQVELP